MDKDRKIYSTAQASEYLDVHPNTLKYHMRRGHLAPDGRVGGNLAFSKRTLDIFRRRHMRQDGYTVKDAAKYLGISPAMVKYYANVERLRPVGKRGKTLVFTRNELDKFQSERITE